MLPKKRIGELLVEKGVISQEQLEKALRLQKRGNRFLGQILISKGWGAEIEIYEALAHLLHVKFMSVADVQIEPHIVQLVPELLAVTRDLLPLSVKDNTLYLVMENPLDSDAIQIVEFTTERQVKPLIAPLSQLREMIRRYYHISFGTSRPIERPTELNHLGLSQDHLQRYRKALRQPQGLVLVTGPPGSGKTTTLYTSLNAIKKDVARNIVTIEDPIEAQFQGIKQIQVDFKVGLTFSTILSLIHDQYPRGNNVIFVGELWDADTAQIVMRATETGHLVLSSLHTPDAVATVMHLFNLGLPPDLIASDLRVVLTQRLVRTICPSCKQAYTPEGQELRSIGIDEAQQPTFIGYQGIGCAGCEGTGYRGQIGLYEIFDPNAHLREEIAKRPAKHILKQLAVAEGMTTLLADGIEKIRQGITTIAEVARVCCVRCPSCGQSLPETETTCPSCQSRLSETCAQCGAKLDLEWRLCPFCGTRKASIL
jgi:energy-coupling factor transporter ATP-binding protein EcfA2